VLILVRTVVLVYDTVQCTVHCSTPQETRHTLQINTIHAGISAFQSGHASTTVRTRISNSLL
jgi:hypothetical protein